MINYVLVITREKIDTSKSGTEAFTGTLFQYEFLMGLWHMDTEDYRGGLQEQPMFLE